MHILRPIALALLLTSAPIRTASVYAASAFPADVFWLDEYGALRWEDEKSRLDNFAIQLLQQPEYIGYIYIWAGDHSCANEAVAHAIKAKRYLTKVRGLSWDRIAFRDLGYRDDFTVKLWLFPSGRPPGFVPEYEPATSKHVIQKCDDRKSKARKS
jgi:hypothetical protein